MNATTMTTAASNRETEKRATEREEREREANVNERVGAVSESGPKPGIQLLPAVALIVNCAKLCCVARHLFQLSVWEFP